MTNFSPNWRDDIRVMFSQYEIVKMRNVGHQSIDLASYEAVRQHWRRIWLAVQPSDDPRRAANGWSRIAYVRRMPLVGEPWSAERIRIFEAWVRAEFPYSRDLVVPPVPGDPPDREELDRFVELSRWLTGFPDLDHEVGAAYLKRLQGEPSTGHHLAELLATSSAIAGADPYDLPGLIRSQIMEHRVLGPVARRILLLWYTSAFYFPVGSPLERFPEHFGTPHSNQYREGLVWRAANAHPMGYSVEDNVYWQHAPIVSSGRFTGNRPDDFRAEE